MKRYALLTAVLLLTVGALNAQTVTTFAGPGIIIDDAIIKATDGTIFGSSYNGTFVYRVSTSGEVSEYMGGINAANGLAFDSDSNLVVAANLGNKIFKVMPDSTKIEFVPNIISPSGIIADPLSDTLYVTQYTQNRVVKIAPDGSITPFLVGNGLNGPVGMAWDENDTLYIANYNDGRVFKVIDSTFTEIADIPGNNFGAVGFLAYGAGKLYATGIGVHRVYQIDLPSGSVSVLAGTGIGSVLDGPASEARFNRPNGILFDPTDNSIYTSGFQSRAIRHITGVITGISLESEVGIIEDYWLDQNYPNPFNPSTTIRFRLPNADAVSLKLYNISGQEIATLLQEDLSAGEHRLTFDADNLASGVYVYRIEAGAFSATKKMALVR